MEQDNKRFDALHSYSLRELVNQANMKGIRKEDIVQIICNGDSYFLVYYK